MTTIALTRFLLGSFRISMLLALEACAATANEANAATPPQAHAQSAARILRTELKRCSNKDRFMAVKSRHRKINYPRLCG